MNFHSAPHNPAFVLRCAITLFLAIGILCFAFPFATMAVNNDNTLVTVVQFVTTVFGGKLPAPAHLSGLQLIFAFAGNETIHPNLNIGPLPCNVYVLLALLCGILSVALLWLGQKRPKLTLVSSLLGFVSFMALIIFRPRFVGYYTAYTKNGGEQFGYLFQDSRMLLQVEPALIVAIVFFFLAFMTSFILFFNAKNDPFFRGE